MSKEPPPAVWCTLRTQGAAEIWVDGAPKEYGLSPSLGWKMTTSGHYMACEMPEAHGIIIRTNTTASVSTLLFAWGNSGPEREGFKPVGASNTHLSEQLNQPSSQDNIACSFGQTVHFSGLQATQLGKSTCLSITIYQVSFQNSPLCCVLQP